MSMALSETNIKNLNSTSQQDDYETFRDKRSAISPIRSTQSKSPFLSDKKQDMSRVTSSIAMPQKRQIDGRIVHMQEKLLNEVFKRFSNDDLMSSVKELKKLAEIGVQNGSQNRVELKSMYLDRIADILKETVVWEKEVYIQKL